MLQKAILPKPETLLIQFRHNAIPLSNLVDEMIDQGLSEVRHNLAVQTDHLLRQQFPKSEPEEHQLLVLVGNLKCRSTTKTDNDAICLAKH